MAHSIERRARDRILDFAWRGKRSQEAQTASGRQPQLAVGRLRLRGAQPVGTDGEKKAGSAQRDPERRPSAQGT